MKKIPTLFERDWHGNRSRVLPVLNADAASVDWVLRGEGVATRKRDGTATLVRGGWLYRRYDAKAGRTRPIDFEPAQDAPDEQTGHWPGWVPVKSGPEDRQYTLAPVPTEDGTYEFCGPLVNGNPERLELHAFFQHGAEPLDVWGWADGWHAASSYLLTCQSALPGGAPSDDNLAGRLFDVVQGYLGAHPVEGIVWHNSRTMQMAKAKRVDFGFPWPVSS